MGKLMIFAIALILPYHINDSFAYSVRTVVLFVVLPIRFSATPPLAIIGLTLFLHCRFLRRYKTVPVPKLLPICLLLLIH